MKKLISILSVITIVLTGCASANPSKDTSKCKDYDAKIGFVTDAGGIDDKSFNQGTWEGISSFCESNQVGATYIETKDSSQLKSNLELMSTTDGIEVVVASGFVFANDMYTVAKENPDMDYILIDSEPINPETGKEEKLDNVMSYYFNEQEVGYLVGYIAGKETKTNRVGFIGGLEIPPVKRFGYGYVQGVNDANPNATVDYLYSGSFNDANVGNQSANTMINQGSDIIFMSAGMTNDGIVKAAIDSSIKGNKVSVIGVDRDMYEDGLYAGNDGEETSVVLTSALKIVGEAAKDGLSKHFDNKFEGGKTTVLGYAENGVGIPAENPNLNEDIVKEAKKALEAKSQIEVEKSKFESSLKISVNGKL